MVAKTDAVAFMKLEGGMTDKSYSGSRRRRPKTALQEWLSTVRHSRRAKYKLFELIICVIIIIIGFIMGFYYFGPSFTNS